MSFSLNILEKINNLIKARQIDCLTLGLGTGRFGLPKGGRLNDYQNRRWPRDFTAIFLDKEKTRRP
jgi:hypothetical protein